MYGYYFNKQESSFILKYTFVFMLMRGDKVDLIKKNGEIIRDIESGVQPRLIFIWDEKIPVEEEDIIEHKLVATGLIERFKVIDRGYYGSHPGFPGYQIKVKRITSDDSNISLKPPVTVIHQHGDNRYKLNERVTSYKSPRNCYSPTWR